MWTVRPQDRTLLVVSGGRDAMPVIAEAQRMGLRVVVSDGAPDAPGFRLADAGLLAPTGDAEATVEAARAYASTTPLTGVLGVGADAACTVAAVAHALGLRGITPATAALLADRLALHACLRRVGLPVPWSTAVETPAAVEAAMARTDGLLVAKPLEGGGGRGVVRLLRGVDPEWAFEVAAFASPSGRVMLEEFVPGPQVHTESVVCRGRTMMVGFADRNLGLLERFAPFVIEAGRETPSSLHPAHRERVEALIAAATASLGIAHGTVQADLAIGPRGPVLLDLAARLSSGYACTHEIPLGVGINFVELAIRLALGESIDAAELRPRWTQAVVQRFLFPTPGTVVSVHGAMEAAVGEGIALLEVRATPGAVVQPVTSHASRGGVVIAISDTRDEAIARAEAAATRVRIVTAPSAAAPAYLLH
jgi:biotin carboxylase